MTAEMIVWGVGGIVIGLVLGATGLTLFFRWLLNDPNGMLWWRK